MEFKVEKASDSKYEESIEIASLAELLELTKETDIIIRQDYTFKTGRIRGYQETKLGTYTITIYDDYIE